MTILSFTQDTTPGPPGLSPRGLWDSNITYLTRDLVNYSGSAWVALKINQNSVPSQTRPDIWSLLVSKGDPGNNTSNSVDTLLGFGDYGKVIAKFSTISDAKTSLGISAVETSLANKAPLSHTHVKTEVGLSNVDNTSDATKALAGNPIGDAIATKVGNSFSNSAITSPAIRTLPSILFQQHDLRDYDGVDYTGNNDSASVVQRAANNSSTNPAIGNNGPLFIPNGKIVLGSPINTWHGIQIQGAGRAQTHYGRNNRGTTFLIGHTGAGFKSFTPGPSEWPGSSDYNQFYRAHIKDCSTERIQPNPDAQGAYTPDMSLGYDFDLKGCTSLSSVHLTNPTRGIKIYDGGQDHLYDISGTPLFIGIDVDRCFETCYFDKIEFWPFWYRDCAVETRLRLMVWMLNNATAFTIGRMDATFWSNIFSIWYQNSLVLRRTASTEPAYQGSMSGVISSINMDGGVYGLVGQADSADLTIGHIGFSAWNAINQRYLTDNYGSSLGNQYWNLIGQQSSGNAGSHSCRIQGDGNKFRIHSIVGSWSQTALFGVDGKQNNITINSAEARFWNQAFTPDTAVQYGGDYTGPYGIVHNNDSSNYVSVDNAFAPNESAKGPLLTGTIYVPQRVMIPQNGNSSSVGRQTTQTSNGQSHTFTS